ncbi:MAG TPA: hypothetical protein VNT60_05820, partial [Deinococcales bacterium]|nr:hypothetical protein [Deinococcales bacterium]
AYPNTRATDSERNDKNGTLAFSFTTNASLAQVGDYYQNFFLNRGWSILGRETKGNTVEMRFRSSNGTLRLEVKKQGRNYRLEAKLQ